MSGIGPVPPDHPEMLADLDYEAIRGLVFDLLHGATVIGPPLDPRRGIRPFEQLSELFRRADHTVRGRITEVTRELLGNLTNTDAWPPEARWDLLDFIQDCGHGVVDDVRAMVRERTLYDAVGIGPEGHAGLIKCLLSLGALSTPVWWLEQFDLLGKDYGALIFSGLVEHGLDEAVGRLPTLCASDHAAQEIRLLIPGLVDQFGLERVRDSFAGQLPLLPEAVAQVIAEDLGIAAPAPGDSEFPSVSLASLIAFEVRLMRDGITIHDMDSFNKDVDALLRGLVLSLETSQSVEERSLSPLLREMMKLARYLESHVLGKRAAEFLWRVCDKLLSIFARQQLLLLHNELPEALHEMVRRDDFNSVCDLLAKYSKPVASVDSWIPSNRSGRKGSPD